MHTGSIDSSDLSKSLGPKELAPVEESELYEVSSEEMLDDLDSNHESVAGKAKYVTSSQGTKKSKRRPTFSPDKIIAARMNKVNTDDERKTLQHQLIHNRAMRKFFNDHETRMLTTFASLVGEEDSHPSPVKSGAGSPEK